MKAVAWSFIAAALVVGGALALVLRESTSGPGERYDPSQVGSPRSVPGPVSPNGPAGSRLTVVTLDATERPLAGVVVTVTSSQESVELVTDAEGGAQFRGIGKGLYALQVAAPGRPVLSSAVGLEIATGEHKIVTLQLSEFSRSIAGRVLARDGSPVGGIRLVSSRHFRDPDEQALRIVEPHFAVTEADGAFEIHGLCDGEYELRTVSSPSYPSVSLLVLAGEFVEVVLEEGYPVAVHGKVVDEAGTSLGGVVVARHADRTRTAKDGTYRLETRLGRRRSYALKFEREGFRDKYVQLRRADVKERPEWRVDVSLEVVGVTAPVSGVISASDGDPVAGETVYLESRTVGVRLRAVSDQRGRFSFPAVERSDDYRLWIYPQAEFKDYVRNSMSVAKGGVEIDIVLQALARGQLHGRMADVMGRPVPGVTLVVTNRAARRRRVEVTGDANGFFTAADVPFGELVFEKTLHPVHFIRGMVFSRDVSERPDGITLVVDEGSHDLQGTITDDRGNPVPGARVELFWSLTHGETHSTCRRATWAAQDGRCQFAGLGPGPHRMKVSAPGHISLSVEYDVGTVATPVTVVLVPSLDR